MLKNARILKKMLEVLKKRLNVKSFKECKQINLQIERQTERQTDRDRWTDKQIDRFIDRKID